MEKLSDDFASFLHQQETNPYSMNLRSEREESIWTVNLLSEEAEQQILPQLLSLETIKLETYSEEILVKNIEIQSLSSQSLLEVAGASPAPIPDYGCTGVHVPRFCGT